jgi:hypothetical protein
MSSQANSSEKVLTVSIGATGDDATYELRDAQVISGAQAVQMYLDDKDDQTNYVSDHRKRMIEVKALEKEVIVLRDLVKALTLEIARLNE